MKKAIPFSFYFVYFAGAASLMPYITLYYLQLGFTGVQVSILTGIAPLVTLFSSPFWTQVADATRRHRLIMSICLVVVTTLMILFPFTKAFAAILLIILIFNLFVSPLVSFADSATMNMLGDEKALYGRLRLGGTIGWGIASPIVGALIKAHGLNMAFWGCAVMMILSLVIGQGLSYKKQKEEDKNRGSIRTLLANREWIFFLLFALLGGFAFTPSITFFSPYMKELGADEFIIGIALLVSTLSEIPVYFFGNHLLRRFTSYRLLIFGLLMIGVRSLLFAASGSPILATLAQLLQGLSFPAMMMAGVAYAYEHAPENMKSTAQGMLGAMTFGIGSALGGLVGGVMLESIGGRAMYLVYGLVVFTGVLVLTQVKKRSKHANGQA